MRKCPYCAEDIQDEAIKCKHCGEFLDGRPRELLQVQVPVPEKEKWYFKPSFLVVMFFVLGPLLPLALPVVWYNPKYTTAVKIVISLIVCVVGYYMGVLTVKSIQSVLNYYQTILGPI